MKGSLDWHYPQELTAIILNSVVKGGGDIGDMLKPLKHEGLATKIASLITNYDIKKDEANMRKPRPGLGKEQLADWVHAYQDVGIEIISSNVFIPPKPEGLDRLIVVPAIMDIQGAVKLCRKSFDCSVAVEWYSLNEPRESPRNELKGVYAIWVRDSVEADKEFKSRSYNQLRFRCLNFLNLCEYLLFHWKYFGETGQHLDVENSTLTSTHYTSNSVYSAKSNPGGELCISIVDSNTHNKGLSVRQVSC